MKRLRMNVMTIGCFLLLVSAFVFVGTTNALEFAIEPERVAKEVGDKVRVRIYANGAQDLVSMGIKLSFTPAILQVESASKYEDFDEGWVMDADGKPSTTGDQYNTPEVEIDNTGGTITMIGGRLMGSSTQGLSGKVLLGWVVFEALANGISSLNVDLAKYHPSHPSETYDNFVKLDGTVNEPINAGNDLGIICIKSNICHADITGDGVADMQDWLVFGEDWGKADCNDPGVEDCKCDLNGDGICEMQDWLVFGEDWGRTDCPTCP